MEEMVTYRGYSLPKSMVEHMKDANGLIDPGAFIRTAQYYRAMQEPIRVRKLRPARRQKKGGQWRPYKRS